MRISIIIPTIGRKQELFNTVLDLSKQTLEKCLWEIIIVVQSNIEILDYKELAESTGINLSIYYSKEPNASLARNIGLIEAKGDISLFLDDDLIIENVDFLKEHLKWYSKNEYSGVFGQVIGTNKEIRTERHKLSYFEKCGWIFFPSNFSSQCSVRNGGAGNLSVKTSYALEIGGMDVNFVKGAYREESDFCLRYTRKYGNLVFDPLSSVIHIGAQQGGCRNWGRNHGIQKKHHIVGEWYFIFRGLRNGSVTFSELPFHLYVLWKRQIWNKRNINCVYGVPLAFFKSLYWGCFALWRSVQKPLTMLTKKDYLYSKLYEHDIIAL